MWLCKTCHAWAHAHPFDARNHGLIVSRHSAVPAMEPVRCHYGWLLLNCDGSFDYHLEDR